MRDDPPEQMLFAQPKPAGNPMEKQGVQPRLAQQNLKVRARRGITNTNRFNFFPKSLENHTHQYVIVHRKREGEPEANASRGQCSKTNIGCPTTMVKFDQERQ